MRTVQSVSAKVVHIVEVFDNARTVIGDPIVTEGENLSYALDMVRMKRGAGFRWYQVTMCSTCLDDGEIVESRSGPLHGTEKRFLVGQLIDESYLRFMLHEKDTFSFSDSTWNWVCRLRNGGEVVKMTYSGGIKTDCFKDGAQVIASTGKASDNQLSAPVDWQEPTEFPHHSLQVEVIRGLCRTLPYGGIETKQQKSMVRLQIHYPSVQLKRKVYQEIGKHPEVKLGTFFKDMLICEIFFHSPVQLDFDLEDKGRRLFLAWDGEVFTVRFTEHQKKED